jgi:exodeoxyribonuclease V beta subunit
MEPFDLHTDPLHGVTLIEAGAGTGKTYTLTGIFLRLIIERGLSVDQILVVTYTKAATEELKTRIRLVLKQAKSTFAKGQGDDEFDTLMLAKAKDRGLALQRIQDALTGFDRAAIFTIHGFCQRLLQHFAFETGSLFNAELVQEVRPFIQEVADDFWRRYINPAPYELARYALDGLKGPEQLAKVLTICRYPDVVLSQEIQKVPLNAIKPWRQCAKKVSAMWSASKDEIEALLKTPDLYTRPYGKCEDHPQRPGRTYRQVALERLRRHMDQWNGRYPLFEEFRYFSQVHIDSHTKKGRQVPEHAFFSLCDLALARQSEMEAQMALYLRYLKGRLLKEAGATLGRKKSRRGVLFFDDLLLLVHQALHGKGSGRLLKGVRRQFRAALVDEFQDTDPLQYDIFHSLFASGSEVLALIGDPKQAIYSFRGADLFSYLKAAAEATGKSTLTMNWRSRAALVKAVNTLFGQHQHPFGFKTIDFRPAVPSRRTAGDEERAPFILWYLTPGETETHTRPVSQQEAVDRIAIAVASEVCRLLAPDTGPAVEPEQIAVLTRTHSQSQKVKSALADNNVPAVLHGAGSVFATREATGLRYLMAAVASPGDRILSGTLLAGDYYSLTAEDFLGADHQPSARWQGCWTALVQDHQRWSQKGFYAMFRGWMAREKIKARLLAMPDGERRLTNLLHLGELVHQAEVEQRLGMDGVTKWLDDRIHNSDADGEQQQLRLESDARAVRIITMHKSKGLQFDVVFCPFVWTGARLDPAAVAFHDPDNHHTLTLSLGPDIAAGHQQQARRESLSENLRMLYVALTRARLRCYMVWGRINGADISAPAYLLHSPAPSTRGGAQIARLQERMNSLTDADCIADLYRLARSSGGAISVQPLPGGQDQRYGPVKAVTATLSCRPVRRRIQRPWRIASFSALTAHLPPHQQEWPDRDRAVRQAPEPAAASTPFQELTNFPKGPAAGLFFHDLLEHWSHTESNTAVLDALVRAKLKAHGFDRRWGETIRSMLFQLGQTVLVTRYDQFALSQVLPSSRINEMAFYFPLKTLRPGDLARVFQKAGHQMRQIDRVTLKLERLDFAPTAGLMKGYMDAVIRFNGRYYLLDWKSNYLGPAGVDYSAHALERTMVEETYFLQYLFYTVALDQLLRQKIQDYDYDRHFGGVLYLFLRGIRADAERHGGVYYVFPEQDLIRSLGEVLIER